MTVTLTRTHVIIALVAVIVALAAVLLLSGGGEQTSQTADRETAIPAERQSASVEQQSVPVEDDTVANLVIAVEPLLATVERCDQVMADHNADLRVMTEKGGDNLTRTDAQIIVSGASTVLDCLDEMETQVAQLEIDFPVSVRSVEYREARQAWEGAFDVKRDFEQSWAELRSFLVGRGLLD